LLHQLTSNADFQNIHNVIFDPGLRVYAVDNSRAFRIESELRAPNDLQCFSRRCLARLRALDRGLIEEKLGRWLVKMQIDGLLARRDAIIALAEMRGGQPAASHRASHPSSDRPRHPAHRRNGPAGPRSEAA
jgi:hypothetical protein